MTDTDPIDAIVAHQARDLIVHAAAGGPSRLEVEACIRTAILLDRERRGAEVEALAMAVYKLMPYITPYGVGGFSHVEQGAIAQLCEAFRPFRDRMHSAALAATDAPARPEGE
jgi:hypothetical protein